MDSPAHDNAEPNVLIDSPTLPDLQISFLVYDENDNEPLQSGFPVPPTAKRIILQHVTKPGISRTGSDTIPTDYDFEKFQKLLEEVAGLSLEKGMLVVEHPPGVDKALGPMFSRIYDECSFINALYVLQMQQVDNIPFLRLHFDPYGDQRKRFFFPKDISAAEVLLDSEGDFIMADNEDNSPTTDIADITDVADSTDLDDITDIDDIEQSHTHTTDEMDQAPSFPNDEGGIILDTNALAMKSSDDPSQFQCPTRMPGMTDAEWDTLLKDWEKMIEEVNLQMYVTTSLSIMSTDYQTQVETVREGFYVHETNI